MAHAGENGDEIIKNMTAVCIELGLTVFSKEEFFAYIQKLNKEANGVFNAPEADPNYFKENYGL